MPDLSIGLHTRSQLYGDTVNPWDASLTPGGSSGGEGVALATGMSPLGLGNDAGGSVRIPALFGGVAALKPSYGRFPGDRSVGPRDLSLSSQLIPVDGVLARTVADLRVACHALAGPDPRDPRVVPAPLEGPPLPGPIRVAVVADPGGLGVHPDARAAVEMAAAALRDAGYVLEEVDVPRLAEITDAYGRMIMTEFSLIWPMLERLLSPDGRRHIEFSMQLRGPVDLAEYVGLTAVRQGLLRDWSLFLARYPIVLGPVFTEPAMPIGFETRGPGGVRALRDGGAAVHGHELRRRARGRRPHPPRRRPPAGRAGHRRLLPRGPLLRSGRRDRSAARHLRAGRTVDGLGGRRWRADGRNA